MQSTLLDVTKRANCSPNATQLAVVRFWDSFLHVGPRVMLQSQGYKRNPYCCEGRGGENKRRHTSELIGSVLRGVKESESSEKWRKLTRREEEKVR